MDTLKAIYSMLSPAGALGCVPVLLYHRVLPKPDPLLSWETDAKTFEMQMRFLAEHFNPLPLSEAVQRLKSKKFMPRTICVTLDDGYADNVLVAYPILKRNDIPATFFITSGYLGTDRNWEYVISESVRLPRQEVLDLSVVGLGTHSLKNIDERRRTLLDLLSSIKYYHPAKRDSIAARIAEVSGFSDVGNISMTPKQVRMLHAAGMDIGAHTVNHPILTTLSDDECLSEIGECKRFLEGVIDGPVRFFAYPNGLPERDYGVKHVKMVKEFGFDAAFSTATGVSTEGSDPYQLPRFKLDAGPSLRFMLRIAYNMGRRKIKKV